MDGAIGQLPNFLEGDRSQVPPLLVSCLLVSCLCTHVCKSRVRVQTPVLPYRPHCCRALMHRTISRRQWCRSRCITLGTHRSRCSRMAQGRRSVLALSLTRLTGAPTCTVPVPCRICSQLLLSHFTSCALLAVVFPRCISLPSRFPSFRLLLSHFLNASPSLHSFPLPPLPSFLSTRCLRPRTLTCPLTRPLRFSQ